MGKDEEKKIIDGKWLTHWVTSPKQEDASIVSDVNGAHAP